MYDLCQMIPNGDSDTHEGMEWFIIGGGVLVAIAVGVVIFGGKSRGNGSVPGRFDFDSYKDREFPQRGLLDKAKWR